MKLLARVDAHSVGIAESVYVTKGPEEDAEMGSMLYKLIFGEHVPWPSDYEVCDDDTKPLTLYCQEVLKYSELQASSESSSEDEQGAEFQLVQVDATSEPPEIANHCVQNDDCVVECTEPQQVVRNRWAQLHPQETHEADTIIAKPDPKRKRSESPSPPIQPIIRTRKLLTEANKIALYTCFEDNWPNWQGTQKNFIRTCWKWLVKDGSLDKDQPEEGVRTFFRTKFLSLD